MNLDTLSQAAGTVHDPTSDALAPGRLQLDAAVGAAGLRVAAARRRRVPRRWGISALVGAAATIAAVIAVPLVAATPASAEGVLLAAAEAAGEQVDDAAGAAYWRVLSEVENPGEQPFLREIWLGRTDDSTLLEDRSGGVDTVDPASASTSSYDLGTSTFYVGEHPLGWRDLEMLPTDVGELEPLLREMVRGHYSGEDRALWEGLMSLLGESPASPALRRALWQIAATMPGIEVLGTMDDAAGRQGTAIELDENDSGKFRIVYILDPVDGARLETSYYNPDGSEAYRQTLLETGPADTAPEAEPFHCGPSSETGESC